jgi:hypothetical protein
MSGIGKWTSYNRTPELLLDNRGDVHLQSAGSDIVSDSCREWITPRGTTIANELA